MKTTNLRIISHAQLVDHDDRIVHELLSAHLRQLEAGMRVVVQRDGSLRAFAPGRQSTARPVDGRVFIVERVERRRAPRTIIELVLARECQSDALGSRPVEVPSAP